MLMSFQTISSINYGQTEFMFSCISLDESVSRESHEILMSPGNSSERWTLLLLFTCEL
jgi:hypothetical protein